MRVLVVGRDVNPQSRMFTRFLQTERPDWDVETMGDVAAATFMKAMLSITADCVILADQWDVICGYLTHYKETIPIPIIAVFAYWTPGAVFRLRCYSVYPMAAPCTVDALLEAVEVQTPILREEIANPERAEIARQAAQDLREQAFPRQQKDDTST